MNEKIGKILIVDDDEDVLQAAKLLLKQHFAAVHTEKSPERIPALLKNEDYDVILLDMNFTRNAITGEEGFFWLNKILTLDPSVAVVLITAYGDVESAVRAIKEGATDFVLKPWQNEKLVATLTSAVRLHQTRQEVAQLRDRQKQLSEDMAQDYQQILGVSAGMQRVMKNLQKVARTDANVLILGENGSGKEWIAREFHLRSLRSKEIFF
ncbi:MAG: sigma-54-dependent Fis family transcriptional regulator, partial [Calditrichaeota bacterium]